MERLPGSPVDGAGALAAWARSGLMWLTGRPGGPPLAPAGDVLAAARADAAAFDALVLVAGRPVADEVDRLLGGRAALLGLERRGATSANGSCRLTRTADGWLALNLARPEDADLVGALLERDLGGEDPWAAFASSAPGRRGDDLLERARSLGLPAAVPPSPGSTPARDWVMVERLGVAAAPPAGRAPLVVDLSSLWAGPLCAHLLGPPVRGTGGTGGTGGRGRLARPAGAAAPPAIRAGRAGVATAGRARLRALALPPTAGRGPFPALSPRVPSSRVRPAVEGGGDALVPRRLRHAGPAGGSPHAQRRPVRMDRLRMPVPVDLPVDACVVLEQEERAGQVQRAERPLGKGRCPQ